DRLAAEGMRFTDAHAPGPLCHMSRYGLMTGRYPFRVDVGRWPSHALIRPGEPTIATVMQNAGYQTAMVGKWHLGFEETGEKDSPDRYAGRLSGGPIDHGFDSFFGIRASTDIPPYFYIRDDHASSLPTRSIADNRSEGWSPIQGAFWRQGGISPGLRLEDVLPRFRDEANRVIDQRQSKNTNQPLFMYLALPSPHTPWLPSKSFQGKSGAGMYGDFMMMVDDAIGSVIDRMKRIGSDEETLVIFSSDNGPVWYPTDVQRFGHSSTGPLRGMKADAWEGGHRMPMIARWTGTIPAGSTNNKLVSFCDLLATFDQLVDGKTHTSGNSNQDDDPVMMPAPDSFSFLDSLRGTLPGGNQPQRTELALRSGRRLMTYRSGKWKLIEGRGSGGFSDGYQQRLSPQELVAAQPVAGQLYDLDADMGEKNNLFAGSVQRVNGMRSSLQRVKKSGHRQVVMQGNVVNRDDGTTQDDAKKERE
ncbi:MAG: arylsulfatase, partial [Planctomycetota bacterium]